MYRMVPCSIRTRLTKGCSRESMLRFAPSSSSRTGSAELELDGLATTVSRTATSKNLNANLSCSRISYPVSKHVLLSGAQVRLTLLVQYCTVNDCCSILGTLLRRNNSLGHEIDNHELVARLNLAPDSEYTSPVYGDFRPNRSQVGSRTDLRFGAPPADWPVMTCCNCR